MILLDTLVALMAGIIVFPTCFAFGIKPDAGPGLIFVTLPNIFNEMVGGQAWVAVFFLFLTFAAMTSVIAVFENLVAFTMDEWHWSRKKAALIGIFLFFALSLPVPLGFYVWSDFQPLGTGTCVLDLEDFILSNNLLPLGTLAFNLFCSAKVGWGWKNFIYEADTGEGIKFPIWMKVYVRYVLPLFITFILIMGYIQLCCS